MCIHVYCIFCSFSGRYNQHIILFFFQLKQMELSEGLRLIQRYSVSSNSIARIWKNRSKVAEIAAHTVLASAMVHPIPESSLLHDLISEWASIHGSKLTNSPQTLHNMVRKMIQTAESSQHIYVFSKVLVQKVGLKAKSQLLWNIYFITFPFFSCLDK